MKELSDDEVNEIIESQLTETAAVRAAFQAGRIAAYKEAANDARITYRDQALLRGTVEYIESGKEALMLRNWELEQERGSVPNE